jgi:hypothetical protein
MILNQYLGDAKIHQVRLSWGGKGFLPDANWTLIFTAKTSPLTQSDAEAAFQKTTGGGGIVVSGAKASVSLLPQDTSALSSGTLYWDIQATNTSGDTRTVAEGTMMLRRDVTRESEPTLDVHTIAPPLLFFSYTSYLEATSDSPPMSEEEWVAAVASGGDAANVRNQIIQTGNATVTPPQAASLLLNPTGDDNDILLTADAAGLAGNSLTGAIAIAEDSTALTAVKTGNNIVATSGDKRRMMITVAGTPLTLEPSGETAAGNDAVEWPVWTLGGIPIAEAENVEDPTFPFGYLRAKFSGWEYLVATSSEDQVGGMPSNVPGLGPSDWPDVLVENFTAATATAAQSITAINAASLGVTASNGPDSDGSGAIAAVAQDDFTGGADGTPAADGTSVFLFDNPNFYVNTGTIESPAWTQINLS